ADRAVSRCVAENEGRRPLLGSAAGCLSAAGARRRDSLGVEATGSGTPIPRHGGRPTRTRDIATLWVYTARMMDWVAIGLTARLAGCAALALLAIGLPIAYWLATTHWRGRVFVEAVVA